MVFVQVFSLHEQEINLSLWSSNHVAHMASSTGQLVGLGT